ncbi:MerR family transcriptional regulator [Sutcliffiella rhizosphaerae]|uniref:HTH merR-type domain-containing protein n=1 Tax=Sutcliffiella rhizosphaerae TaxID=2880967 RepID=A0ABN8A5E9_9BACI|nr:MerR family transcriptional regulator [Sutcliffiella rhizosphaerae]CAG9620249.1 hypothetical protein BACCIP111883_01017 [Sutcliffiella rhizosphaerae]
MRPIDIAKRLGVSTSTLRHYEEWGIVPEVNRNENGYRMYTELHVAYFDCIRAMNTGFGMNVIREIMPLIQRGKISETLWKVSKIQSDLYQEKIKAEQALQLLEDENYEIDAPKGNKKWYSIKVAAEAIGVPMSTLRHWEKEQLIVPERNPDNGYRCYSKSDLRKLLIIRTLQNAVYSLDIVRDILDELNYHNVNDAIQKMQDSLDYLDYLLKQQLRGVSYLYRLCEMVEKDNNEINLDFGLSKQI